MIIAVDFDGTIHNGEYPNIGEPVKDSVEILQALHDDGHSIIIWTCRAGKYLDDAIGWLERAGVPFDAVNEHDPSVLRNFGTDTRKVYADVYIDDHNIGGLPSWKAIYRKIQQL